MPEETKRRRPPATVAEPGPYRTVEAAIEAAIEKLGGEGAVHPSDRWPAARRLADAKDGADICSFNRGRSYYVFAECEVAATVRQLKKQDREADPTLLANIFAREEKARTRKEEP